MPMPSAGSPRFRPPARYTAPVGVAAVVLGLSLGPHTAAVAAADPASGAGTAPAADTATTATTTRGAAAPRVAASAPRAANRNRSRAAVPGVADHRQAGPIGHARARRAAPEPGSPVLTPAAAPAAVSDSRAGAAEPTPPLSSPAVAAAASVPVAPPAAMSAVRTPLGAASSSALGGGGLLAQFKALFDGAALLVRRSLFNKAPTVSPVQLTGQAGGPITGTIGATDPEGDPLTYRITTDPVYGTVTVSQDGHYSYTPDTAFPGTDMFVVTATDGGMHINLLDPRRPAGTAATVSVRQGAASPRLSFEFNYGSGSQLWSPAARSALESAAARLAGYFVVAAPVTLTFDVTGQFSPLSSTLASAGSDFADPLDAGFLQTVVQNKIQSGVDSNGSAADGTITWNFGPSWAFGDSVGSGKYDFQAIAMHELLHTFGVLSDTSAPGTNTGRTWAVFDSYLVDSAGNKVITGNYRWDTSYNPNLTGRNGGLFFGGPNAVAANGGPVSLYTPSPWESGSSVSHLNDAVFYGANSQLMNAETSSGPGVRTLSPVELGILTDIGYQVSGGSPGLMLIGLVFARRTRRRD